MPHSALKHPTNASTVPVGYEDDFALWVADQVALLQSKKLEQLDRQHLIEELSSMGSNLHRELRSRIKVLIMHLLKCEFQPEHKTTSWEHTIDKQREEIRQLLEQSPSLKTHVNEYAQKTFALAAKHAAGETGLPRSAFPLENPYSVEQLLDPSFIP